MSSRVIFQNGTVVSMVPGEEPRQANVLVIDGDIAKIGDFGDMEGEFIDATDCIVAPGFVDTHRHVWQTQLRGVTHDWSLKDYIRSIRLQSAVHYRPEDMYVGNYLGMLEAINAGVTTVLDFSHCINSPEHATEAIRGTRESGIRSIFALGLNEVPLNNPVFNTVEHRIDHAKYLRATEFPSDDALVTMGIALSDVHIAGIERVTSEVGISRELDIPMTFHANAVLFPDPVSEVAFLEEAGLLGPDLIWVHMNLSTDEELRRVIETGGAVSCTPETEMQMGMGNPVFGRFIEAGGHPGLGCDVISNNSGCLFSQMRLALQAERMVTNDKSLNTGYAPDMIWPTTGTALRAATVWGAEALGLDAKIGTLEVGKQADVIMIRGDDVNMLPVNKPVGSIVLHAHPGNVDTVMVAGRILKRNGQLLESRAQLRGKVRDSHDHLMSSIARSGGLIPQPPAPLPW
ncbi:amidohydrolase family protein [Streptomyces sioyaensis]|uniref:amidohydrolase family protein n=1 Tax=Streptomyces sioyaensis TaxID=67364 RepID=UPI003D74C90E